MPNQQGKWSFPSGDGLRATMHLVGGGLSWRERRNRITKSQAVFENERQFLGYSDRMGNYPASTDRLEEELRGLLGAMRWSHIPNKTKARVLNGIQHDLIESILLTTNI